MTQRYSPDQVQKILVQAMQQAEEVDFSRSQLEEMALDLGISAHQLDLAEAQLSPGVSATHPISVNPSQRETRRQKLKTYVLVNSFLLLLNFSLCGSITWAIYPLLGWGLGLCLQPGSGKCSQRQNVSPS